MSLLQDCYAALDQLPVALCRAWPQASPGLPALMINLDEDLIDGEDGRLERVAIKLRCASPEQADQLAASVETALEPLKLRRIAAWDAAEKDGSSYLKLIKYERRLPPPGMPSWVLTLGGIPWPARLMGLEGGREVLLSAGLSGAPRPAPGPMQAWRYRLRLPLSAYAPARAALEAGLPLSLAEGAQQRSLLLTSLTITNNRLELTLHEQVI